MDAASWLHDIGYAQELVDSGLHPLDGARFLEARPAHVVRFGTQIDIKGVIAPSEDANRTIRYLTKYLTKSVAETHADPDHPDQAYEAHIDRLHEEVRSLPCSETCANWLRFGIQKKDPGPGLTPGMCPSKAHDRENLGLGGRRVQVSPNWSGKSLAEHKADRAEVVRQVLEASGITPPERNRWSADVLTDDGKRRFVWEDMPTDDADYIEVAHGLDRRAATLAHRVPDRPTTVGRHQSQPTRPCGRLFGNPARHTTAARGLTPTTRPLLPRPPDNQPHPGRLTDCQG